MKIAAYCQPKGKWVLLSQFHRILAALREILKVSSGFDPLKVPSPNYLVKVP